MEKRLQFCDFFYARIFWQNKKKIVILQREINNFKVMNAYKFKTKVSDRGVISLPYEPHLYNKNVEDIIIPLIKKEVIHKTNRPNKALDFVNKWKGAFSGLENITDEEIDNLKYERLLKKYTKQ